MTAPPAPLPPGTLIETLRIERVLDYGAFAITYLVTDTVLSTAFALKEYYPQDLCQRTEAGRLEPRDSQSAEPFASGLQSFLAEGQTVAALSHPNVVRVFRCFEANGTAYLQMPYYRGEALHRLLERGGALSEEEALALARPLLDALGYLHGHGVIHQDLKPANIYVTEQGDPILLDFGAAGRHLRASADPQRRFGSEGYAAIEQSDPEGRIGPWTDIYGFAATLYRCVSGRIPASARRRKDAMAQGMADPLDRPGSLLPARDFAGVIAAIEHGLALEPADRPRSVADWRASFGTSRIRAATEEREWLPWILLTAFFALLVAAVVYLVSDERRGAAPERPASAESAVAPEAPESPEEAARWQATLEADTAYGYRLFLEDYPASIHRDQAVLHLQRLDDDAWSEARSDGSQAAIEAYLERFPGGSHEAAALIALEKIRLAAEAAARLEAERAEQERQAWETARRQRTLQAIDEYLAAWPGGSLNDEARTLRRELQREANDRQAYDAAAKLDTISAYRSYVDAFPRGAHVAQALRAIDDLTLRPGKTFRDCADCPVMVVVPAGSFWQGGDPGSPLTLKKETPRRMVNLSEPFAIGLFEVTMEQWDRCVAENGCATRPLDNGWGRGSRPVIMVSWNDAMEYSNWLSQVTGQSYSLPSESQWEYAARGGEESDWLGGAAGAVCEYANVAGSESGLRWRHEPCADPAALQTLPVGSLRANAFGLHDVIGNVAEWTLDCLNLSYLDAPVDGSAWGRGICSSRMTRGGSWFTGSRDIRLPARFNLKNGDRNDFTGFRVVRKVAAQE